MGDPRQINLTGSQIKLLYETCGGIFDDTEYGLCEGDDGALYTWVLDYPGEGVVVLTDDEKVLK